MATPDSEQVSDSSISAPTLPGHTVDELRSQGNAAEARAEFERLIEEGMDSGVDPRTPTAIFDSARAEIRGRTSTSSGDVQGVGQ